MVIQHAWPDLQSLVNVVKTQTPLIHSLKLRVDLRFIEEGGRFDQASVNVEMLHSPGLGKNSSFESLDTFQPFLACVILQLSYTRTRIWRDGDSQSHFLRTSRPNTRKQGSSTEPDPG